MPSPTIRSRPKYAPFELVSPARSHLIISDCAENLPRISAPSVDDPPLEFWTIRPDSRSLGAQRDGDGIDNFHFRSAPHLFDQLSYRLGREHVGLHLYAIGTEAFIWDIAKIARQHGMDRDEYHLTHRGSENRRVYCVHCRAITEHVRTTVVNCSGCGAHLQVRDHFSQRLAAFMGFQVDAEVPGELPPIEEAYP